MKTALFNCKRCKVGKRIEYPEYRRHHVGYGRYQGERFRLGEIVNVGFGRMEPRKISPSDDALCPSCGKAMTWDWLQGFEVKDVPCDARCTGARGHTCECSCAGKNHGAGWQIGKPLSELAA
jgi:hypothetical protein